MKKLFRASIVVLAFFFVNLSFAGQGMARQMQSGKTQIDTMRFRDMQFRPVGPARGGRVTAVEGLREKPHTFYMGSAAGGGVWRTDNYGQSWKNITDGKGFKSTAIGAIEVADSDTSIIYAGTGSDAIRDNVLTGRGVYKSTDSGEHWQFMGLKEAGQIGAIKVDPHNPDRVYVAALGHPFGKNEQRGVFRSDNGGKNWEKVLFASDSTGAVDLELNPENPDEIYAALWRAERKPWTIISGGSKADGLYKSTDGGDHWKRMSNGLPQDTLGKADFAVTAANPDRVYALVEASGDSTGLYRSEDRGEHWKQVSDTTGIMNRPFYFTNITADPNNADVVYVGDVSYWKSKDGGKTFKRKHVPHGDVQALWINPANSDIQIQGSDGGATVTLDGGKTWSTQFNQPTAELWQVNVDDRFPYRLYGGQQDRSTIVVPSLPPYPSPTGPQGWWQTVGGCETGPAVPVPNDPTTVYANCKGRFGRYNVKTGQEDQFWVGGQYMYGRNPADLIYRFQRTSPIEISPHDSSVVYHGSQYVHRTTDGGATWNKISPDLTAFKSQYQVVPGRPITRDVTGEENFSTLNSIRVSPHDQKVIWTAANDGPVHISRNAGKKWTDVTPDDLPPNATVDAIAPSPHQAGKAYIAAWRRFLDDFHPYIYRTTDYGRHWTLLTDGKNGIPADHPTRVVREDPERAGLLYAGTDWGLFTSFDDGQHWQPFRQGLPTTAITDIRIHDNDLVLSTFGRGFWILDDLSVLRQLSDSVAVKEDHLFKPETAYRMRYRPRTNGAPQYPTPGVYIDFYLPDMTETPVVVDITDAQGGHVQSFVGKPGKQDKKKGEEEEENTDEMRPDSVSGTAGDFAIHRGHNRFKWDLRYPAKSVQSSDGEQYFGIYRGPLVAPGRYRVRLSVGDWSSTQPLTVQMDPRIQASGITVSDLKAQRDLNLKIRDATGRAKKMAAAMDTLRSEIKEAMEKDGGRSKKSNQKLESLDKLHRQLVTNEEIAYPPPMLIDQLQYLYGMTASADQRPARDAFKRYKQLSDRLQKIDRKWQSLKKDIDHFK